MKKDKLFMLRLRMRNAKAFDRAVEKGYIRIKDDGHLEWMLDSQTLLAYFLGRLYCGDHGKYSRRDHVTRWQKGEGPFPAKALGELYGCKWLKQLRDHRENLELPEFFLIIDELFY